MQKKVWLLVSGFVDDPTEEYFFEAYDSEDKARAALEKEIIETIDGDGDCASNDHKSRTLEECVKALDFFDGSYEVYVEVLDVK